MNDRTILIFPHFSNMEPINAVRKRYDPLADLIKPHITLVFPFKLELTDEQLRLILKRRLTGIAPFELELSGVSMHRDAFGSYLFLNVQKGADELTRIHKILYANEFKSCHCVSDYVPHMTLGNFTDPRALEAAYEEVRRMDLVFRTVVRRVHMEMIGERGKSVIVIEQELTR